MVDLRKPCGLGARATVECLRRHGYPPWRTRTHDAEPGVRADPPASGFFSYECPVAAGRSTWPLIWLRLSRGRNEFCLFRASCGRASPIGEATDSSVTTVDQADMRALVSRQTVVRHGAASL